MWHLFAGKNQACEHRDYPKKSIRMRQCTRDSELRASRAHPKRDFASGRMSHRAVTQRGFVYWPRRKSERDFKLAYKYKGRTSAARSYTKAFIAQYRNRKVVQNFKVAQGLTSGHLVVLEREDQGVTTQQVSPGVALWAQVKHLPDYSTSSSSLVYPWRICLWRVSVWHHMLSDIRTWRASLSLFGPEQLGGFLTVTSTCPHRGVSPVPHCCLWTHLCRSGTVVHLSGSSALKNIPSHLPFFILKQHHRECVLFRKGIVFIA